MNNDDIPVWREFAEEECATYVRDAEDYWSFERPGYEDVDWDDEEDEEEIEDEEEPD